MITRAPLDVVGFLRAANYINNKGEHPKILTAMVYNKIVLSAKELTENNWLYIGKETEEEIKWQLNELKEFKDFVPILE